MGGDVSGFGKNGGSGRGYPPLLLELFLFPTKPEGVWRLLPCTWPCVGSGKHAHSPLEGGGKIEPSRLRGGRRLRCVCFIAICLSACLRDLSVCVSVCLCIDFFVWKRATATQTGQGPRPCGDQFKGRAMGGLGPSIAETGGACFYVHLNAM